MHWVYLKKVKQCEENQSDQSFYNAEIYQPYLMCMTYFAESEYVKLILFDKVVTELLL